MKTIKGLATLALVAMSITVSAESATGNGMAAPGNVRGRVVDAEQQILPGASIYVEDMKVGVVSDVNGFYTLSNLKPGKHTIKVSYVGYTPYEFTVDVKNGTLDHDIVLHDGTELGTVQVVGAFSGQRKALSMQKNMMGITNVVSADQVGKFPDSNIGDALKRINGINVQYDQGEALRTDTRHVSRPHVRHRQRRPPARLKQGHAKHPTRHHSR